MKTTTANTHVGSALALAMPLSRRLRLAEQAQGEFRKSYVNGERRSGKRSRNVTDFAILLSLQRALPSGAARALRFRVQSRANCDA